MNEILQCPAGIKGNIFANLCAQMILQLKNWCMWIIKYYFWINHLCSGITEWILSN